MKRLPGASVARLRRPAAALAALAACTTLAACGSSAGLIPETQASALEKGFEEIAKYAQEGKCTATQEAIETTQANASELGNGVNAKLRATIERGIANLRKRALIECRARTTATTTTTTTTTHALTTSAPLQITESTSSTTSQTQTVETPPTSSNEAGNGGTPLPSEGGGAAGAEHPGAPAGEAPGNPGGAAGGPARAGRP